MRPTPFRIIAGSIVASELSVENDPDASPDHRTSICENTGAGQPLLAERPMRARSEQHLPPATRPASAGALYASDFCPINGEIVKLHNVGMGSFGIVVVFGD
jgi:hypothetical protein